MIADFKTRIYCADTDTPRQEVDVSDPLWNERITAYFDGARGFRRLVTRVSMRRRLKRLIRKRVTAVRTSKIL